MKFSRVTLLIGVLLFSFVARLAAAPTIDTQPGNATIIMGASGTLTVAATTSGGALTYQWQALGDLSVWDNLDNDDFTSGVTTATFTINGPAYALNGAQVRCIVTDSNGSTPTTASTLTLTSPAPLLILAHPTGMSAFQGDTSTAFTIVATGTITAYQWQRSTDGGSVFNNLSDVAPYSGTATATLTIADAYTNLAGYNNSSPYKYRCQLTNSGGAGYAINSKSANLHIFATPAFTPAVSTRVNGSPSSSIAYNDTSPITVRVTGSNPSGTIRVERYADLNGNSAIDPGEPLVQSFTVTDGSTASIGGVTVPLLIPGDTDVTADGTVMADFSLGHSAEMARTAGAYLFKVISPGGSFRAVTSSAFTLTQPSQSRSISGTVLNGVTPVPYAQVAFLDNNAQDDDFVGATVADGSGNFTFQAAPGSYSAFALAAGYVGSFGSLPTLTSGTDLTGQTVAMAPAAYMHVMQVQDQGSGGALRGVQVFFQSDGAGVIDIAMTDSNGVATAGAVAASDWGFDLASQSLAALGYVMPSNNNNDEGNQLYTTNGTIGLQAANALIYGTLTDNAGTPNPIAGVGLSANDQNNNYQAEADTDANGNYYLPVYGDGSTWNINVSGSDPVFGTTYIAPPGTSRVVAASTAYEVDFVAAAVTAHLTGTVTNADTGNSPVGNAVINLYSVSGQNYNQTASRTTDASGNFDFGVIAGSWQIQLESDYANSNNLVTPVLSYPTVTDGNNVTGIAYAVKTGTGTISGTLTDFGGATVPNGFVNATATISTVTYRASSQTNGSGQYSLPVINGTWTVSGSSNSGLSFQQQSVTATGGSNTLNFSASVFNGSPGDPADQAVNAGSTVGFFVNTNAPNTPTRQWQVSTDGGSNFTNLPAAAPYSGTTGSNLSISPVTLGLTGYKYRLAVSFTFNSTPYTQYSRAATLTVNNTAPSFSSHPSNQTTSVGSGAAFSVSVGGAPTPTLQWQVSTDGGSNFNNLSNGGYYSDTTTATLIITGADFSLNGYRYRAVATNVVTSTNSNSATLSVNVAPTIDTHPSNQTVTVGANPTFSVSASGSPSPSIQWQLSTDNGNNWNNLGNDSTYSGVTSGVLTVTAAGLGQSGYRFRAIVTNAAGSAGSNDALLTVNPANVAPTIGTHPSNQTVTAGSNATFAVAASGTPSPTIQWQLSTDGGSVFNNLSNDSSYSGVTTTTLTVTAPSVGQSSYRYRAVATNVAGSANSNNALLTVNAANVAPTIDTHPSNQSVTAGSNATFTVAASGTPSPTYQWQLSTDGGSNWNNVSNDATYSGVTTTTLTVTATLIGQNGYRYRAVATNVVSSANSNSATLTVSASNVAPTIDTHPSGQTVTAGSNATFTVAASGTPTPTYQWQLSTDGGSIWNNLTNDSAYSGVTTTTLTVTAPSVGQNSYRYRAVATNVAGSTNSNDALLTVNAANVAPTIDTHPSNQTVTAGSNATFTVAASGTPSPTIQWQLSTDGGSVFNNLSNDASYSGVTTTTLTVTAPSVGQNSYRYRAVATNVAGSATSNNALLTVNAANVAPTIDTHPSNQSVTVGSNATFTVAASGTPSPTYQWQLSTDGGSNWNNVSNDSAYSGVTTTTLTVTAPSVGQNGYRYRAVATNVAGSANSNSALLTVNVAPSITSQPSNQSVTAGQNATFTVAADGTPAPTFQWQLSTDGGSNWNNIANGSSYSGVTTVTLTVISTIVGQNGYRYRAVATNGAGSATSNGVTLSVQAAALTVLHHFNIFTNAGNPVVSEALTLVGNTLYGTTYNGGVSFKGTIFSINKNGSAFNIMHSFSALNGSNTNGDGQLPGSTLTFANNKLYGTASSGGTLGNGVLYSINPDGTGFTPIFNFSGSDPLTSYAKHSPFGQLTQVGGILYGVTVAGGNPTYDGSVNGKIFAYNLGGSVTTPYVFPDVVWDGDHLYTPYAPGRSVVHLNGKLYGTTMQGGYDSFGTVFSVNTNGSGYTTLHQFMDTDGKNPIAGMILAGDTLYGTTQTGGANNNRGVIFSIKVDGSAFTVLHHFSDAQGFTAEGGLLVVGDTLYGGTGYGGAFGYGTVFSMKTNGTAYTVLHSFNRFVDGSFPTRLIRSGNVLYGMTGTGGTHDYGTIFSLTLDFYASFTTWQQAYFTAGELLVANISGPNAIIGLDGLPNLVKYGLGLDPTVDATTGLPVSGTAGTDWVYTYTRPASITDVTYAVEVSTNLATWTTAGVTHEFVSTSGGTDTWRAKYPLASATNIYFRLKIVRP